MISLKGLYIFYLESIKEKVIKSEHCNSILESKSQHKSSKEVIGPLDGSSILSFLTFSDINSFFLNVHPNLKLHIFDNSLTYFLPVIFKRSNPIRRYRYRVHFVLLTLYFFTVLLFCRLYQLLWFHC